jgi:hypothetical protein
MLQSVVVLVIVIVCLHLKAVNCLAGKGSSQKFDVKMVSLAFVIVGVFFC